nr:RNA-directed DNA polymerase, eukaryota [Tanacetum cinerariifolium]
FQPLVQTTVTECFLKQSPVSQKCGSGGDDQDDLSSDGESQEGDVANKAHNNNNSDVDRVSESSFIHENDIAHKDVNNCKKREVGSHSEDPFNIYGILDGQKNNVCNSCSDEPKFPPGFTPDNNEHEKNVKSKVGESILDIMDELVTVGQTMGYNMAGLGNKAKRRWIKKLCQKHRINFASIQETKVESISLHTIKDLRDLWDYLRSFIDRWECDTVIMGDFNKVRSEHERFGSTFISQGAIAFNNFISSACLIDLPLEGYAITWAHKSASKMSKLDRYLISEGVLDLFPHLSALCLDRHLSDHRLILLRETNYDYGPSSFWKINIQQNLLEVDKLIDHGKSNDEIIIKIITLLNDIQELNNMNAMKISQKSKIRWSIEDLERTVTYEEVKRDVLDCGTNKSPRPDGFSFEFYCKYWTTIDDDVFQAVIYFFVNGNFPRGCNSSFIDLIPKIQDAKFVKDFHPISLIGIVYKIIAKIFANRLCVVLPYLISDVQLAFVANHQILDGPFILNELLSGSAPSLIGCSILTAPFNYLGVKVGSNMSRITSWDDVISKVSSRLSKWKLKLLSIGDRLSLLKSVLTSIPLYDTSIFKVPIGVLDHLESIRQNFFYGVDGSDRKLAWIGWNMVLTSKKNDGLGVSSFFAHNCAILFKMPRGGVEKENYDLLRSKVADLVLPNVSDRWCWSLEGSQEFSVKSSRILIDNTILPKAEVPTRRLRVVPIKAAMERWDMDYMIEVCGDERFAVGPVKMKLDEYFLHSD